MPISPRNKWFSTLTFICLVAYTYAVIIGFRSQSYKNRAWWEDPQSTCICVYLLSWAGTFHCCGTVLALYRQAKSPHVVIRRQRCLFHDSWLACVCQYRRRAHYVVAELSVCVTGTVYIDFFRLKGQLFKYNRKLLSFLLNFNPNNMSVLWNLIFWWEPSTWERQFLYLYMSFYDTAMVGRRIPDSMGLFWVFYYFCLQCGNELEINARSRNRSGLYHNKSWPSNNHLHSAHSRIVFATVA